MNAKNSKLLQQLLNGVLIAVVIVLVGFLSVRYKLEWDWTAGGRNTLTAASQKLLQQMPEPIHFTALLRPDSETRKSIEMMIGRYQRAKPGVTLDFVDPDKHPEAKKKYENLEEGGIVVEYQDRHEILGVLSEPAVTGALQRLMDKGDHYVVFLEGHGERSPDAPPTQGDEGAAQTGYGQFAAALREKGLKVQGLNLVKTPSIPDNTSVLVVASPTQKLLDGEIKIVDDYVKAGGNLLWLNDPGQPPGLEAVSKTLGVSWENGFAVFPDYRQLGSPSPAVFLAGNYPPNPVTQDMAYVTVFPLVRPLNWDKDADRAAGWDVMPLIEANENSWLETKMDLKGPVTFDEKAGDKSGPLTLGLTMSRQVKAPADKDAKPDAAPGAKPGESRTQRVAVLGDSDFLADGYLGEAGNKQLGINLLQWLASRDALLNIDVPKAPDASLSLSGSTALLLMGLFFPLLPLALLGYGITRWVRRRRR
jgi:ABC-type uncharacterized transport system involved in gliding motility auxiliary subunit